MAVVKLPYDPLWQPLDWAKENCPSYVTNDIEPTEPRKRLFDSSSPIYVNYYFTNERDATLFALKWL